MSLSDMMTPALLLDRGIMQRNIRTMASHIQSLGCVLRPHVKTHKSAPIADVMKAAGATSGITVSTLEEARCFFDAGYDDILYAVGIAPNKIPDIARLQRSGCTVTITLDSVEAVYMCNRAADEHGVDLRALIELDVDGHRAGVAPEGKALLEIASALVQTENLSLAGVMTHAGGSYDAGSRAELEEHAARERDRTVLSAQRLRTAGFPCPIVSIGSTPTATVATNLEGVTEVRAGVYVFHDLYQVGLGVAKLCDIALSVATTVIGHQRDKGWLIVDAGWMAMSRDRSTQRQTTDQGYGLVCSEYGEAFDDMIMVSANQEHGIVCARSGTAPLDLARFPIGSVLRILPNHACATAAQFGAYEVVDGNAVVGQWDRVNGW